MALPAIPLVYWIGGALLGGGVVFGKEFGEEVGERVGKTIPLLTVSALALMAYKAAKK